MRPAHQCLHAGDRARLQGDQRLVHQEQLVARARAAEVVGQAEPVGDERLHARRVVEQHVAAQQLGAVESDVDVAQQLVLVHRLDARVGDGDACGGGDHHLPSRDVHRCADHA